MTDTFYPITIFSAAILWLAVRYGVPLAQRRAVGVGLLVAAGGGILLGLFLGFSNLPAAICCAAICVGAWAWRGC